MNLKDIRTKYGLSQSFVSSLINVPVRTYRRYELDESYGDIHKREMYIKLIDDYGKNINLELKDRYSFDGDTFVIKDFQRAKKFCSFLPAIAGVDGKPLWAFYANVGQALGGFGIDSKEHPFTPFDSKINAYQNIPLKGFRTFLKIDGKTYTPFFDNSSAERTLKINRSNIVITERNDLYEISITYSTISHKTYPALIRKVSIKNIDRINHDIFICDGLPIFFPYGLNNYTYKEMGSLMASYCSVNLNKNAPFVMFKSSTSDEAKVELNEIGNAFISIDQNNNRLINIVDLDTIFSFDTSLVNPLGFIKKEYKDFLSIDQQLENKLPCAFSLAQTHMNADEEYSFVTLFGNFANLNAFNKICGKYTYSSLSKEIDITEQLLEGLLPSNIKTSKPLFDKYISQSVLDNNLRGGFLTMVGDKPTYVFSRKHGDMERDYNAFSIPDTYYSSGPGNFRDVNQNRRNDLYFVNEISDYNIKTFFDLIQIDGQNPLTLSPSKYVLEDESILKGLDEKLTSNIKSIKDNYKIGQMYEVLLGYYKKEEADNLLEKILTKSKEAINASFKEGYWIDHWTYNLDLIENYVSIYPDKLEQLFFRDDYRYFYSKAYIEPRDEKYCLVSSKVRQYGSINLEKLKEENRLANLKGDETLWLTSSDNGIVHTSLAAKLFNLIIIKFASLDANQIGIEMDTDKPGWNDSLNGLPGLLGSSTAESIELLRLIDFVLDEFLPFSNKNVPLLSEQYKLYESIDANLKDLLEKKIDSFTYWDNVSNEKEKFRLLVKNNVSGKTKNLKVSSFLESLKKYKLVLQQGLEKAKKMSNGIMPTYLINEVSEYSLLDKVNHLGYQVIKPLKFKTYPLPLFLESNARLAKLGQKYFAPSDYEKVKSTNLYDKKLGIYKTCEDIDKASFEIGRIHSFSKGWLERESDFLHMTYKYMLGLLRGEQYQNFFSEIKTNFTCFMNPNIYRRSPIENCSFIVPSNNVDSSLHGSAQFARLTGANSEVIDMFYRLCLGPKLFVYKNNELYLNISPKFSKDFFDENGEITFPLFKDIKVTLINKEKINCYEPIKVTYRILGKVYNEVKGDLAESIRQKKIKTIDVIISSR